VSETLKVEDGETLNDTEKLDDKLSVVVTDTDPDMEVVTEFDRDPVCVTSVEGVMESVNSGVSEKVSVGELVALISFVVVPLTEMEEETDCEKDMERL